MSCSVIELRLHYWGTINSLSVSQWNSAFCSAAPHHFCLRNCSPQMDPYLGKVLIISGMSYFHIGLERNIIALKFIGLSSLAEQVSAQMVISCYHLYSLRQTRKRQLLRVLFSFDGWPTDTAHQTNFHWRYFTRNQQFLLHFETVNLKMYQNTDVPFLKSRIIDWLFFFQYWKKFHLIFL